jgi:undecaprenyl-diphosphatase
MNTIQAIILGIVEGITEFLPISSTGHMILVSSIMGISSNHFVKLFEVAVQLGAILSVLVLYWKRFIQTTQFYVKLFFAFVPAAVVGLLLHKQIDNLFENPVGVSCALLIGGIILLFVDKWFKDDEHKDHTTPSHKASFVIGLFQVISLFPGVSRSAATIIGGLSQKLSRRGAAEFSFFLAVPVMFAATAKKLYDFYKELDPITHEHVNHIGSNEIKMLIIGNVVAFIVAMIAIKFFINFLSKNGFRLFGIYRIIIGIAFLALYYSGSGIFGGN